MYDVYVNVNYPGRRGRGAPPPLALGAGTAGYPRRRAILLQPPPAFALDAVDLGQHRVDVLLLLQQAAAAIGQQVQELGELRPLVVRDLVEVEQFRDLGQREAQPLAAQDQLQPDPLALAVDPRASLPGGRDQPLVLVEADRARRQREFAGEFGDRVGRLARGRLGGDVGQRAWTGVRMALSEIASGDGANSSGHDTISVCLLCDPDERTASAAARLSVRRRRPRPAKRARSRPACSGSGCRCPFALDHINLWLLEEDDGWTLVDCGYGDASRARLWEAHFAKPLGGRPVTRIVATHFHPDHLGNAAWLMERFALPRRR